MPNAPKIYLCDCDYDYKYGWIVRKHSTNQLTFNLYYVIVSSITSYLRSSPRSAEAVSCIALSPLLNTSSAYLYLSWNHPTSHASAQGHPCIFSSDTRTISSNLLASCPQSRLLLLFRGYHISNLITPSMLTIPEQCRWAIWLIHVHYT